MIVLAYTYLGGLSSAIYNEVLQFFIILIGLLPIVILALMEVGGWSGLKEGLAPIAAQKGFAPDTLTTTWKYTGAANANPMGVKWYGIFAGLGFVLSFGYWCTNFLIVQRAMAAESTIAARKTPLIGAIPKMFIPFLIIVPGIIALVLINNPGSGFSIMENGKPNYDLTIIMLLKHYLPAGVLGVGITALLASFMSGMAGNVSAFNTVWTYDIYQSYIRPATNDAAADAKHYLRVGRLATIFGVLVEHRCGLSCRAFWKHHGFSSNHFLHDQCTTLCSDISRNVLETNDCTWCFHRVVGRFPGGIGASWSYSS